MTKKYQLHKCSDTIGDVVPSNMLKHELNLIYFDPSNFYKVLHHCYINSVKCKKTTNIDGMYNISQANYNT